jgi:hypothetical protein
MNRALFALATAGAMTLASAASAHAHLTASDPDANATVAAPRQLTLRFSETLNPKFSGLTLTMPQTKDLAVAVKVTVSADGKALVATPSEALSAGAYKVTWHAVTADTHRVQGSYDFTVK